MLTKILRYAIGRNDKIVLAYEDVTFENEYMDWYVNILMTAVTEYGTISPSWNLHLSSASDRATKLCSRISLGCYEVPTMVSGFRGPMS